MKRVVGSIVLLGLLLVMVDSMSAAVNPPFISSRFISSRESSEIFVSAYIPETDVVPQSVQLVEVDASGQGVRLLGTLNDAGRGSDQTGSDKIYSGSFTPTAREGPMFIRVSAAHFHILRRSLSQVVAIGVYQPVPVADFKASYEANLRDSFTKLLALRASMTALNPDVSVEELRSILLSIMRNAEGIRLNFLALSDFELSGTPQVVKDFFSSLLGPLETPLRLMTAGNKALNEVEAFIQDGTDPQVQDMVNVLRGRPDILARCGLTPEDFEKILPSSDSLDQDFRACLARHYHASPSTPHSFATIAQQEGSKVLIKQALNPATDVTGELISDRLDLSPLGNIVVKKTVDFGTGIVVDRIFDVSSDQEFLLVGEAQNNESIEIPMMNHNLMNHDLLLSAGDTERSIVTELIVPTSDDTTVVEFVPGLTEIFPLSQRSVEIKRVDLSGFVLSSTIQTSARVDSTESDENPAFFTNLLVADNPHTASATDRPEYLEEVATCNTSGCRLVPGDPDVVYAPASCDGTWCSLDADVLDGGLTRIVFLYDTCAPGFEKHPTSDLCVPPDEPGPPPSIAWVFPPKGTTLGGTSVTFSGANLTPATTVTIGGNPVTAITFINPTTMTAITPAGTPGAADVGVSNTNGSSALPDGFTYTFPFTTPGAAAVGTDVGEGTLTVTLPDPAIADTTVTVENSDPSIATLPDAVTITAGSRMVRIPVVAGNLGTAHVTIGIGAAHLVTAVFVVPPPPPETALVAGSVGGEISGEEPLTIPIGGLVTPIKEAVPVPPVGTLVRPDVETTLAPVVGAEVQ